MTGVGSKYLRDWFCIPLCGLLVWAAGALGRAEEPEEAREHAARSLAGLIEEVVAFRAEETNLPLPEGVDTRYKRRLEKVSLERYQREAAGLAAFLERLKAIDREGFNRAQHLDADVLERQLGHRIAEIEFGSYLIPITNREGFHIDFARLPERTYQTVEDYDRYIARLQSFAEHARGNMALMREGLARGITLPRVVLSGYEATIAAHVVEDATQSAFYRPLRELPGGIPDEDRRRILEDGRLAIRESVLPGYREFLDFMVETYIPGARDTLGASRLPGGEAFYSHRAKHYTTLDLSPLEVHQTGLNEVARILAEMEALKNKTGFVGDLDAFLHFLRTDPQFYVTEPEDYIREAAYIAKRMDGELPKLFKHLPNTPYGLKPIPDFIAPKTTGAYYSLGRADGSRAGHYFLNLSKLESRPLYVLEALTFHEAAPGHHLQIMLLKENEEIPSFRRDDGITAFTEGWALYAERLGLEVGFYTDPYMDFGRLTYEIWRACRLVVDTGIHVMDWTREQAIDYMKTRTALSLHEIATEVDRYISWPGQALAYKIGELKIRELRARAEKKLGKRFDLREFHHAVLKNGSIPLNSLEKEIDIYIEETLDQPHPDLARLLADVQAWREERTPLPLPEGTDSRYRNRLPDISEAGFRERAETLLTFQRRLDDLPVDALAAADRLDAAVLWQFLRNGLQAIRFQTYLMPLSSREGFHISFARLPETTLLREAREVDDYIARLQSFQEYCGRQIELMRKGIELGLVLPSVVLRGYETTISSHIVEDEEASAFYLPLLELPASFSEEDRERMQRDGLAAVRDSVLPGYRELLRFFTEEYLPATRATLAATALPNGEAYYRWIIRRFTTLEMEPRAIHDLGLQEVARLREEMDKVMRSTGFDGDLAAFLHMLRKNPKFYVDRPEAYLKRASLVAKTMEAAMPELFDQWPTTPYGMRSIPEFVAARSSSGYYDSGDPATMRAGFTNLNTSELTQRPTYLIEALVLHEGVPGHHLQIMLQRENDSISTFRQNSGVTAYVEGWALYAERLGLEVGIYDDPYSDFGRLTYEIWRACRLVVDTGIHALGWSRERAIAYMEANTALSTHEIAAEVDRYISEPGQALAYKIGELKITELRARARTALGARFDLKQFHGAVLENGAIPLRELESQIEAYIAKTLKTEKPGSP